MKIVILLLLGLASLGASAPQSRFGTSRFQPARTGGDTGDTTEAADVADGPAVGSKASNARLHAAGPAAGADEDDTKADTSAKPFVVDGEKKPAYGLDGAKERMRLSNLRRRLLKPNNVEGEESAVTAFPGDDVVAAPSLGHRRPGAGQQDSNDEQAAAPALGHRRPGAGQQDSNDEQAAAPASGHRRAGAGQQDSNDQELTPAKDEGSHNPPASNIRRRFHSTSSSSSLVSDASQGNKEETSASSTDDSPDQLPKETTFERRRPTLRRRQQSTPAPSDDKSQDESSDAGTNPHAEATDSTSPAEKQKPAAGTPSGGSMKERLERYRQRQAERLGAVSQTGAADGSTGAQTSDAQSDASANSSASAKSDAAAGSGATADASATGSDSQSSGDGRPSA